MVIQRIKYALYLPGWVYGEHSKATLRQRSQPVPPNEYDSTMDGHIFCPECCVALHRSPKEKAYDKGGRPAFFMHARQPSPICSLRVKQAQGKNYENEEEATQAIENNELVVVKEFMQHEPIPPALAGSVEYRGGPVESVDGEPTEVAIGRHNGESFTLPSRITTVRGLCRNFHENYYKYLVLPGTHAAIQLRNVLIDVATVTKTCDIPRLYWGEIERSYSIRPAAHNIRMTKLKHNQAGIADFHLKITNRLSSDHGIEYETRGRIVIMYGKVTISGTGLCIERLGWGELALLPSQYEHLLK